MQRKKQALTRAHTHLPACNINRQAKQQTDKTKKNSRENNRDKQQKQKTDKIIKTKSNEKEEGWGRAIAVAGFGVHLASC
jgi:hypothetical protein